MILKKLANTPTLRLLCSITGGQNKAVWEDVTGSTPLNFQKQNVSFTTTVSARFWLMDTRNVHEVSRIATLLYNHEMAVPYMAKFVIFAKRVSLNEARIRVFCMTDDKEDKTLELHENFIEIAKSKDVEVMDGSSVYVDFSGNLIPILKMGEQSVLQFRAFQENRLAFTLKLKDPVSKSKHFQTLLHFEKIQKFRVILSSGGLDICRRAIKVTVCDSAETGPHIHIFFLSQGSREHGEMPTKSENVYKLEIKSPYTPLK